MAREQLLEQLNLKPEDAEGITTEVLELFCLASKISGPLVQLKLKAGELNAANLTQLDCKVIYHTAGLIGNSGVCALQCAAMLYGMFPDLHENAMMLEEVISDLMMSLSDCGHP
jgi:hypothetical protein